MRSLSKFRGCLFGGAAGDALGYSVEYLTRAQIEERYGENGILGYDLTSQNAIVSDDTQMTLFTANGLLAAKTRSALREELPQYLSYLAVAYLEWHQTQRRFLSNKPQRKFCWLSDLEAMRHRRAPNPICLQVLEQRAFGTIEKPCNASASSNGLMRVAPIGLFFDPKKMSRREIDLMGASAAAMTAGHPNGYISAAAMVHMISRIIYDNACPEDFSKIILETEEAMISLFGKEPVAPLRALLRQSILLAKSDASDLEGIAALGSGWDGHEALAIACFCVLRYPNSFGPCIIAAANHDGDSDTVASVAGNLFGAFHGMEAIPEFFLESLELRDVIDVMARDLWTDCPLRKNSAFYDEDWMTRYVECRYEV